MLIENDVNKGVSKPCNRRDEKGASWGAYSIGIGLKIVIRKGFVSTRERHYSHRRGTWERHLRAVGCSVCSFDFALITMNGRMLQNGINAIRLYVPIDFSKNRPPPYRGYAPQSSHTFIVVISTSKSALKELTTESISLSAGTRGLLLHLQKARSV